MNYTKDIPTVQDKTQGSNDSSDNISNPFDSIESFPVVTQSRFNYHHDSGNRSHEHSDNNRMDNVGDKS